MDRIAELFDRMDAWRHLPSYQLERRSDVFFSLYLAEALEAKLGFAVRPELVPEFPLRKGTVYPHLQSSEPLHIDYLALSAAGDRCVLVELKTDNASRRNAQDQYLKAAQSCGLPRLIEGVSTLFCGSAHKRKYFALLRYLEQLGLLEIPPGLTEIMGRGRLQGAVAAACDIKVTAPNTRPDIVYVQPSGDAQPRGEAERVDLVPRVRGRGRAALRRHVSAVRGLAAQVGTAGSRRLRSGERGPACP